MSWYDDFREGPSLRRAPPPEVATGETRQLLDAVYEQLSACTSELRRVHARIDRLSERVERLTESVDRSVARVDEPLADIRQTLDWMPANSGGPEVRQLQEHFASLARPTDDSE